MNKSQQFIGALKRVLNGTTTNAIKASIGDSTDNNRTLSVNQLIRFLNSQGTKSSRTLAADLELVYGSLRPIISRVRVNSRRRTDAIDINEFATAFGASYYLSSSFRRSLGRRLTSF